MSTTKIICTIGPASANAKVLRSMAAAGMDVARLNFSHGTHEEHHHVIRIIRALPSTYRRKIRILQDLEGYRVRVGKFKGKKQKHVELKKGQVIRLTNREKLVDKGVVPFDYQGPLRDIRSGSHLYIDDGTIALKVKARTARYITAEVLIPGIVKEGKGINIPDCPLRFTGLTEKDKRDLQFGIAHQADFIAQSFVRNRQDIIALRDILNNAHGTYPVIAKIEDREGVRNIDQILDVADGIMIARGDLGVSLPIYEVPLMQKMIIKRCSQRKKMVITATQMLESMTEHRRPTRAEVSDVANAIIDGSGYVMLSAETAVGKYPVEALRMMKQIITFTEKSLPALYGIRE